MLNIILGWFVAAIFNSMQFFYECTAGFIDFSQRNISYLITGIDAYLPVIGGLNYDSVIYGFAVFVILWGTFSAGVRALVAPLTGQQEAQPLKIIFRVCVAVALVVLAGDIQNLLFNFMDEVIKLIGELSAATWAENLGDLVRDGMDDNMLVALVFAVMLFFQFVPAIIGYVERYIMFGIYMIISPAAFAFIATDGGEDIPKQWFQAAVQHLLSIILSYIFLSLFIQQIPSFASDNQIKAFVISTILLGLVKNTEKLLAPSGIKSVRAGQLARVKTRSLGSAIGAGMLAFKAGRWANNFQKKLSGVSGGIAHMGKGSARDPITGAPDNEFRDAGKDAAMKDYTPGTDKDGMLEKVSSQADSANVEQAVKNTEGYDQVPFVNRSERQEVREGYGAKQREIANAVDNVREAQQGIAIQTDADGNVSNVYTASGEKFNGTAAQLGYALGTGDFESVKYSTFNPNSVSVGDNGYANLSSVTWANGDTAQGADLAMTKDELMDNIQNGNIKDFTYTDSNGNTRTFSKDDMHTYTPYVSGKDFHTAFGLENTYGEGSHAVEDSRARFGGFETKNINGQQRLVPTFGAGATHIDGKQDQLTVVSASENLRSDAIARGRHTIDNSRYDSVGGNFKAYRAPMMSINKNGNVNKSYGEFVHSIDSKHFDNEGHRFNNTKPANPNNNRR